MSIISIEQEAKKKALKFKLHRSLPLYPLALIPIIWYIVFCYIPMGGLVIAFKDYNPYWGILESPFLEEPFENFERMFEANNYFWQAFKNTFRIGSITTIICYIAPIILALMFNELKNGIFKKSMQCISYMPYFVSTVALVNILLVMFGMDNGIVNNLREKLGEERISYINQPSYFIFLYILLNLWRGVGWGTIIYLASLSSIDPQLYEVADIEGANRFQKIFYITIPSISQTLIVMLILALPGFLGGDFETLLLMQTSDNLKVSDITSTYIYRRGIGEAKEYSYTTAIGLFMSIVNLVIIYVANFVSKKVADVGLF